MIPAIVLASLVAFSPLEAEQEDVRQGNEKLVSGAGAAALGHYDEAERRAGSHPEIDYDRGQAAFRLGKLEDAESDFKRAAEKAPTTLSSRALQNLGNTLLAKGDKKGAMSAYAQALTKDPKNEDARYDLEVLLRQRESPKDTSQKSKDNKGKESEDKKAAEEKKDAASKDGGERKPPDEAKENDAQASERDPSPKGQDERKEPASSAQSPDEKGEGRQARAREPFTRQDAEKLLDGLRAREKKMPISARVAKTMRRPDAERDW